MAATKKLVDPYDVVIVGSGVAGALVAAQLVEQGHKVLVLEAGSGALDESRADLVGRYVSAAMKVPESPYLTSDPKPLVQTPLSVHDDYFDQGHGAAFKSNYERRLGGSTWHWLGIAPALPIRLRAPITLRSRRRLADRLPRPRTVVLRRRVGARRSGRPRRMGRVAGRLSLEAVPDDADLAELRRSVGHRRTRGRRSRASRSRRSARRKPETRVRTRVARRAPATRAACRSARSRRSTTPPCTSSSPLVIDTTRPSCARTRSSPICNSVTTRRSRASSTCRGTATTRVSQ